MTVSNLDALVEAVRRAGKTLIGTSARRHRPDGSVYTKPSLAQRRGKRRRIEKNAKQARKHNR